MLGRRLHHPGPLTVPTTLKAGAGQGLSRGGTRMGKETQSLGQDTLGEELGRWGSLRTAALTMVGGEAGLCLLLDEFGYSKNLRRNKLLTSMFQPLAGASRDNE